MAEGNASSIVARSWPLLLAATILCGLLGYAVASSLTPSYRANVELLTGPVNTDFTTLQASGELARTYAELATTRPLLESVAQEAGIEGGADALDDKIDATSSTVTRVVTIYATDSDPQRARDLATDVAKRLRRIQIADQDADLRSVDELMRRTELQGFETGTRTAVRKAAEAVFSSPSAGILSVVNPAETPKNQAGPPVALITALAALAGFVIAFMILWLRDVVRRPVRSEADLADVAAVPPLATVRIPRGANPARAVVNRFLDPTIGPGYRLLYAGLGVDDRGVDLHSVAVIDADDHANAQAVGAGIASAAAEAGIRTALIDPTDDWFGTTAAPGSSRDGSLEFSGQLAPGIGLVTGVAERNADDVGGVLAELAQSRCSLAVVVLPPITQSAATVAWARSCDATVLAASRFRTSASALAGSADALRRRAGVHLVGTVLVESKPQWQNQLVVPTPTRVHDGFEPHVADGLQPAADTQ